MSAIISAIATPRESFDEHGRKIEQPPTPVIHDVDVQHSIPIVQKIVTVVVFYLLASIFYANVEGWNTTDCIYFITVTIATVGYGDYHPTHDGSRLFTIFMILIGLIFIFSILSDFSNFILNLAEEQAAKISKQKDFTIPDPWKYWKKRAYSAAMVFGLVFLGTMVFMLHEEWTFIQALYFTIETVTTVGYGDLEPTAHGSKVFLIFFIPISVCVVAGVLGSIAAMKVEMEADRKKLENLNRKLDFNMIREMDTDGNGVDKCEFLVAMLVQTGVCDKENDIDPWLARFDQLDKDGSGMLDGDDIAIMEAEEKARIEQLQATQKQKSVSNDWGLPLFPRGPSTENPLNAGTNSTV